MNVLSTDERQEKAEARRSCFSSEGWEYCDLTPWLTEIVARMHEAAAAGTNLVNLSWSHPRGFIPNQIVRRRQVRELLKGWRFDNSKYPPNGAVTGGYWAPRGAEPDLETCSLLPFRKEVERREAEALATHTPLDLTPGHPRGGIPEVILRRLAQRVDKGWRAEQEAYIGKLRGDANRAAALAQTLHDKMDAVEDPRKLKAASRDQLRLAEDLRAEADKLEKELR